MTDSQLHPLQPQSQVIQEGLHVGNDHLELRQNLVKLLPFLEKNLKFLRQLASLLQGWQQVQIRPIRFIECCFTYNLSARIHHIA